MKKIIALILALVMVLSFAACGKKTDTAAADTYLSMAQEFIDKNDFESAIDILNKGYSETKDSRLSEKLIDVYAQRNNTKGTEPATTEPTSTTPAATEPAGTTPTTTEPPATNPPETIPPATTPPATTPPETTPPATQPSHAHSYTFKVTAATCTAQGYTTYTCTCGHSYTADYTSPKSHSYSKKVTAATCTAQGYTTYTCACGHTYKDSYTNPSHNYSNYVCSKCGTVDKAHAYEYLMEWVKANGTQDGSDIRYTIQTYSNAYINLSYSPEFNNIYLEYYTNPTSYSSSYTQLQLNTCFYGFSFYGDTIYGYVDAARYSDTYTLTYVKAECYTYDVEKMLSLGKPTIDVLLVSLKNCLLRNNLQISIADLGFTSYS